MITFNLKKKQFKVNDKWPLLYIIAEIYNEESSSKKPLTYLEVVELAKIKYGINVERRTVSQYVSYLEDYFDFVFIKSGYGRYLKKEYEESSITKREEINKHSYDKNIETIKLDDFKQVEKNIEVCEKGIKENILLKYRCPKYITQNMEVVSRTLVLVPLKIFQFNLDYFLLAYYPPISDYYFVNLSKTILNNSSLVYQSSLDIKQKLIQFDLKVYLNQQHIIGSGRSNWKSILVLYRQSSTYPYEDSNGLFTFETNYKDRKIPIPEILTILDEIYGEDKILGPTIEKGPYATKTFSFGICDEVYYKNEID